MCTVCGCSTGETRVEGKEPSHEHHHDHSHTHDHHHHDHDYSHAHSPEPQTMFKPLVGNHHYGLGPARVHAPGLSQTRMVQIEQDILGKNNSYAQQNRRWLAEQGIFALNLVSSPGSGKTSLLVRTLTDLKDEMRLAVIEGDQETAQDADRIRATGCPAIQINTGKGCHLDAHMVGHALESLQPQAASILFIENVGNLVCPAAFDLGEAHKVAILSVTEGEDKPIKYPDMFHAANLLLLNKIDLLPYLQFDVEKCIEYARRVNPSIQILQVSATTGEGMQQWYQWLRMNQQMRLLGRPSTQVKAELGA
ncbi:hydrogenase nickel incorporation protein HypB [uncultured Thiothrix sp.]|uniref:hydrogenase nickel incorporation protein HypB n=1 Tax=uncultured Thiothrix sp. TaxID=223185 RepID=UPI00261EBFC2|nr:hydrogenase nickel incorporation protein HypB [uncultured Thiothrix sp.]HMT93976.1 hydrogenase nickel incorporation protein HypB [Thiolinea sp.]